jgi:hypothetical protein
MGRARQSAFPLFSLSACSQATEMAVAAFQSTRGQSWTRESARMCVCVEWEVVCGVSGREKESSVFF